MTTDNTPVKAQPRAALVAGNHRPTGIVPRDFDQMYRMSSLILASGLAPKDLDTEAKVMAAMQMGLELGLQPMQALTGIAVINGRPALWGHVMTGLIRAHGHRISDGYKEDGQSLTAWCTVRRGDTGEETTRTFSMAEATEAGLTKKSGPWQQYPKRMLLHRARAWACRDACGDVLGGMISDTEAGDLEPIEPAAVPRSQIVEHDQAIAAGKEPPPAEVENEPAEQAEPADEEAGEATAEPAQDGFNW